MQKQTQRETVNMLTELNQIRTLSYMFVLFYFQEYINTLASLSDS